VLPKIINADGNNVLKHKKIAPSNLTFGFPSSLRFSALAYLALTLLPHPPSLTTWDNYIFTDNN
jgi:hypothetical protein